MIGAASAQNILVARKIAKPLRQPVLSKWRKPKPIREATYCILSVAKEARAAPRRRTRLKFVDIADLDRRFIAHCAVQDISFSGARLKMPFGAVLPARFLLIENKETILATMVWRRGDLCGVRRLDFSRRT